jgi:VCBS repeat-containing protein
MTPVDYGYKSNAGWDDQKFLVTLNVPSGVASLTLRLNSTLSQGADDESWGIDNFNSGIPIGDGSIANTFAGVAISNYTADASKGQWQYSTDASNWSNLPTTTASSAVTLRPADYLRFLPAANYNGQATALSANLIESGGSAITSGATVNLSASTVYSQSTVAVSNTITPVNDAPRLTSSTVTLASVLEDVGNAAPGARVSDLFIYVMDDSLDNGVASLAGVAISSYTVDTSKGNWQYSTDGSTWLNLASATINSAITLRATDYLRFVPAANYNGQATALSANIIETGGAAITSGAVVNLSNAIGSTSSYSQQTVSVNHTITSVNDAPVIGGFDAVVNYISTDFTTAPANAIVSGSATISNGECVLTPAIGGQNGYLLFNTLPSNPTAFSAQFDYRVADGSGADGTSFNYGPINGLGNLYEYGITNSGLVVSFIEYGSQRVEVKFNGALLQSSNFTLLNPNYQRIIVNVDGSNKLSLSIGGVPVVSNLDLGSAYGNANKASWQFGFASRTGGATNKHSVDNLNISSVIAPVEALEQNPTILNGGLTLADLDNPTLASATVSISNGFRNNEDVLGFVSNTQNYGNIAGTFSTSTGVLALTSSGATATLAQWQAALRSVTYTNTSDTPNTSNRVVSFVVNDGISDSTASTVTLKVTPVNDVPVANTQTITTNEDTTYTGALSGSDVEGSALTYSVVTQGARGVVTITNPATGAFTYVPSANANGSDSFTFKVNDGSLDSTTGTVTVNITPVNDAPTIVASQPSFVLLDYQFTRNWGVDQSKIDISKSDVDGSPVFDNAFLTSNGWASADNGITFSKNMTYGNVALNTTSSILTYYLNQSLNLTSRLRQGQTVTETIPIQVTDGQLNAITNAVFTIDGQNDEPGLNRVNNLVGALEDNEYEFTYAALTDNSQLADIDGEVTSFVVKSVTNGVLKIGATAQSATPWNAATNATITTGLNGYWTPALNANGTLGAFTVVVKDNGGLESLNPIQVNVQVAAVNDPPTLSTVGTLTGSQSGFFNITYEDIADLANESDIDSSQIYFRIESVNSGELRKISTNNLDLVVEGSTLIGPGESLLWYPPTNTFGLINAFKIKAWDGTASSESPVQIKIQNNNVNFITVDSAEDFVVSGKVNLRQAIEQANTFAGDTVVFLDAYLMNTSTVFLNSPLTINNAYSGIVHIAGYGVQINGNNKTGLVYVNTESSFSGITFSNGTGAGISPWGGSAGGAIYSNAKVVLTNCLVENNSAVRGAGIYISSEGRLISKSSTIAGNNGSFDGGGVFIESPALVSEFNNSTIANNKGHGVFSVNGPVRFISSTITGNTQGVNNQAGSSSFVNTIVSLNLNGDINSRADATNVSYSLFGLSQNNFSGSNNIQTVDPKLGALDFYDKSFVPTIPLLNGSPAIDAGTSGATIPSYDSRYMVRVGKVDIGAFERQNPELPSIRNQPPVRFLDTPVFDNYAPVGGTLIATSANSAPLNFIFGISGENSNGGIVSKVGQFGKLDLEISTGNYKFIPNNVAINSIKEFENRFDVFPVDVSDGTNKSTFPSPLVFEFRGANDKPIVSNIAPVIYTNTNAVDVFPNATGFISASDADSSAVLAYGISGQGVVVTNGIASLTGLYGTLSVEVATGQYTYSPNQNQLDIVSGDAVDNFTVTVSDGIASVNKPFVVNINDRETPSVTIS